MNQVLSSSIDQALKDILLKRLDLLQEYLVTYDFGDLLTVHIVEVHDSIEAIEARLGFSPFENLVDDARYPHPAFEPSWEFCIDRKGYYDVTFALCDSGLGLLLLVPDQDGVVPELREMLKAYATTNPKPTY